MRFLYILLSCFFSHAFSVTDTKSQSVIHIGSDRELFIDDYLIDQMIDAQWVLHHPVDEGPVLQFDNPWEGPFSAYCTVIKDADRFRAYYRGLPIAGADGSVNETTCVAVSYDGLLWEKPDLGIYEIYGTRDNNVILAKSAPFSHNFSPFVDANPNVEKEERYKALSGTKDTGLFGFKSGDGIHWEKISEQPIFKEGIFDSQNVAFWSVSENKYICYFRSWSGDGYSGFRSVSRTTSEDFIHWSAPVKMDFGDTPMEHLYTNQTHSYFRAPQIYIATAARFMPGRQVLSDEEAKDLNVNPKYYKDCSDVVLITSRGGNQYDRTFMSSLIRPGIGAQNWVSRSNYPALNVVQTSDAEMSLYVNQDYAQPTAHLRRYSLRLDGFGSVQANYEGGKMITKPFTFKGDDLFLNFSTSAAGEIKVEILDDIGNEIPGYTANDCVTIIGNEINKRVSWGDDAKMKFLEGKVIQLRFIMKDANLYSIKFE